MKPLIITILSLSITAIPVPKTEHTATIKPTEIKLAPAIQKPPEALESKESIVKTKVTAKVQKSVKTKPVAVKNTSNADKQFIYHKESTNRLHAENKHGCRGLGQDCNGKLHIQCPNWKKDRNCQDKFFTTYMKNRYGSWAKAKAHWLARVHINGKDVGNWW